MAKDESAKPSAKGESVGKPVAPLHAERRERLRERFRKGGAEAMRDHELLEMILSRSLPRRDVKPLAKALIEQFDSLAEIIGASSERLMKAEGMNRLAASDLKLIHAAAINMSRRGIESAKSVVDAWKHVIDYCHAQIAYEEKEALALLFLDENLRFIDDEIQRAGTVDHAPIYPREVVDRAMHFKAKRIMVAHNHPSGNPEPSDEDFDMTNKIIETAGSVGIKVYDHVIIGKEAHFSFRETGMLGKPAPRRLTPKTPVSKALVPGTLAPGTPAPGTLVPETRKTSARE